MACITIADEAREITDVGEIKTFLSRFGIHYEQWPLADRVNADAANEEILAAYAPEIERLKQQGGYVTADVINITPDIPGLDAMLNRFSQEHTHSEDEVRFILKGRGVFHVHPPAGAVFALQVDAGDLINVPAGTQHWFDLCSERTIRAIRMFQTQSGWTPFYTGTDLHSRYEPVCLGPAYFAPSQVPAIQRDIS